MPICHRPLYDKNIALKADAQNTGPSRCHDPAADRAAELKDQLPVEEAIVATVVDARETIRRIIGGADPRLLCIVGPCSIHDPDGGARLRRAAAPSSSDAVAERLFIVMRVYFEKPRTTVGWKGLINDPHMDDSCDMPTGLRIARQLLLDINRMGLGAATEMLDPITPQYIADLIAWAAIGARTTESQTHREMASGLSMPVGFKNTTDGNLQVAVNAIESARQPHSFLGIKQDGLNRDRAHHRQSRYPHRAARRHERPTTMPRSIDECVRMLAEGRTGAARDGRLLARPDQQGLTPGSRRCSPRWSSRSAAGSRAIMGVMVESNIEAGNQPLRGRRGAQVRRLDHRPVHRLADHRAHA